MRSQYLAGRGITLLLMRMPSCISEQLKEARVLGSYILQAHQVQEGSTHVSQCRVNLRRETSL